MRGIEELKVDPSDRAKLLKSWIPQADLCSWTPCVQCNGRNARAGINLDFSFEKPLTGRLPAAWGAIGQTLRSINLRYDEVGLATSRSDKNESCRLASPYIPQTWSNLTRTTLVRLSNLGLQGAVPVLIFADMPNLRFLTLANNQFTALPAPAPGEFKALTAVDLSYNMLGQSALPELEVGALPALESLNLGYNMLQGRELHDGAGACYKYSTQRGSGVPGDRCFHTCRRGARKVFRSEQQHSTVGAGFRVVVCSGQPLLLS